MVSHDENTFEQYCPCQLKVKITPGIVHNDNTVHNKQSLFIMDGADASAPVIGGFTASQGYSSKIYFYTCSNQNCNIKLLSKELPVPNGLFVAIAIPDELSNCMTNGKDFKLVHMGTASPPI